MRNKDILAQETKQLASDITAAVQANDEEAMAKAFTNFSEKIAAANSEEIATAVQQMDNVILTARGKRVATSAEREFGQKLLNAAASADPRQAVADLSKAFPETIIDTVLEDIAESHPLLDLIDMQNTRGQVKMIINADGVDVATWAAINTTIATELAGTIDTIDVTLCKLSAFLPVPKDSIDLGAGWVLNLVMVLLSEAIARGLENGVINGTGKNQPIGMIKDLAGAVTEGVYTTKTPVALTALTPTAYNAVVGTLATNPNGGSRVVSEVILICNPADYITKILPATTVRAADGTYNTGIFPFPTKAIPCDRMGAGYAVMGLPKKYFMGVGLPKSGKIEFSDEYQFLEDNRVYLTKLTANGRPKDNNAFVYLDISGIVPANNEVVIKSGNVIVDSGAVNSTVVNYEQQPKALNVTSVAGQTLTKTAITVAQSINAGNTYKYKTAASLELPLFNTVLTTGWTAWNGSAEIVATTGQKIAIVEVDSANKCKAVGEATVTSKDS